MWKKLLFVLFMKYFDYIKSFFCKYNYIDTYWNEVYQSIKVLKSKIYFN